MDNSQKTTAPIWSTAGAVPVKTDKGMVMQKVKVNRYVTGKRPDFAPDSSSDESDEEFVVKKTTSKSVVAGTSQEEDVEKEEKVVDRRLRRLQEVRRTAREEEESDSDSEDDRVARHRREVIEPEIIAEGTDSEDERVRRHDDDESSEEEELDDEEIEKRRLLLRQRAQQRKDEEELLDLEEEKSGADSEEESSEYEEYTDSEEETGPRLKPIFVRKKDRFSIQEKERNEAKQKDLEAEAKKLSEERRKQTLKMVEDERRRELEAQVGVQEEWDALDSGDDNDEDAYEAWKVRELRRLKRDREERENTEKEKMELERVHNLTEEERRNEFQHNPKERTNKAPKGKYKFLQKYFHRGAFFMDSETEVFKQDFSNPTLEDHFDKTVLPKVMQVKNFGRSGRTKYTHLVDQDTTQFDSPWAAETAQNIKFHTQKGGGTKQVFDRPSEKLKK